MPFRLFFKLDVSNDNHCNLTDFHVWPEAGSNSKFHYSFYNCVEGCPITFYNQIGSHVHFFSRDTAQGVTIKEGQYFESKPGFEGYPYFLNFFDEADIGMPARKGKDLVPVCVALYNSEPVVHLKGRPIGL